MRKREREKKKIRFKIRKSLIPFMKGRTIFKAAINLIQPHPSTFDVKSHSDVKTFFTTRPRFFADHDEAFLLNLLRS